MIKVIKIGKIKMPDPIVEFTCHNCGCVFTAEKEDYVDKDEWTREGLCSVYLCVCPCCDHAVVERIYK